MLPKISFITAVKDRSEELKVMLASLINQDMTEWETIIVDDHSTEQIQEIVESFNEPRFKYFRLPDNLAGVSNARNFAISKAQSEILLTADGDDINWPARAHVTYNEMMRTGCDVFYSHVIIYFSDSGKRYDYPFQPFNTELFKMVNFITNPGTAFRKDAFLRAGGYNTELSLSEDYDLYLRILNNGGKFGFSPLVLVEYRIGNKNVTVQKQELMHQYIQKVRTKNNLPPVNLDDVKKYAIEEIADNFLHERNVWQDDRFTGEKND